MDKAMKILSGKVKCLEELAKLERKLMQQLKRERMKDLKELTRALRLPN